MRYMRYFITLLLSLSLFMAHTPSVYAAAKKKTVKTAVKSTKTAAKTVKKVTKKAAPAKSKKKTNIKSTSKTSSSIYRAGNYVSAGLSSDGASLIINFFNLKSVKNVSYMLTYTSNGVTDGAGGTIDGGTSKTVSRSILFGTCSSGVCVYDGNLSNVRVKASVNLKSGKAVAQNLLVLP